MNNVEEIKKDNNILAIIIRNSFTQPGVSFFTPNDYSQQLAYMQHPKGKHIHSHIHNEVKRSVYKTQEVLFIRKGKLRVDLYGEDKSYLQSHILYAGDVVLLIAGGHGFEVLEDVEMIEVKQGPYAGEKDKTLISPVEKEQLNIQSA